MSRPQKMLQDVSWPDLFVANGEHRAIQAPDKQPLARARFLQGFDLAFDAYGASRDHQRERFARLDDGFAKFGKASNDLVFVECPGEAGDMTTAIIVKGPGRTLSRTRDRHESGRLRDAAGCKRFFRAQTLFSRIGARRRQPDQYAHT
jgi:hypothetical protein